MLCWYIYRRSLSEIFRINVIASNDSNKTPIMTLGSTTFFHVRHANLYLACATRTNVNAALVFEFIYRVISIGRSYFGKLDEEAVKNNFVLIYELLDGACVRHGRTPSKLESVASDTTLAPHPLALALAEILDFGYPQNSETDTLKMYITTEGVKSEQAVVGLDHTPVLAGLLLTPLMDTMQREDSSKITIQATGATSWRRADVKYKKNEAFVDVVESVNLLMSSKGVHHAQSTAQDPAHLVSVMTLIHRHDTASGR